MIRSPFRTCGRAELAKLTCEGISYPHKVMPWMAQNRHKINLKLFAFKKAQLQCQLSGNSLHQLERPSV